MGLTISSSNYFWAKVHTVDRLSSYNVINQDFLLVRNYKNVYPIVLNTIYTLTREGSATNSLYLSFTVNTAGVAYQIM